MKDRHFLFTALKNDFLLIYQTSKRELPASGTAAETTKTLAIPQIYLQFPLKDNNWSIRIKKSVSIPPVSRCLLSKALIHLSLCDRLGGFGSVEAKEPSHRAQVAFRGRFAEASQPWFTLLGLIAIRLGFLFLLLLGLLRFLVVLACSGCSSLN